MFSKLNVFAVLSLSFVAVSPSAPAATVLSAEAGARITSCVQGLIRAESSQRPRTADLQLGQEWVCTKILFLKSGDSQSDAMQTLVITQDQLPVSYLFKKQAWGVQNYEGSAKGNREASTEYLSYDGAGIDGLVGQPFGIKNGFFWDFLRLTAGGELVSEESILESDLPNYIVGRGAPDAIGVERNKVYAYSVCKTHAALAETQAYSCF